MLMFVLSALTLIAGVGAHTPVVRAEDSANSAAGNVSPANEKSYVEQQVSGKPHTVKAARELLTSMHYELGTQENSVCIYVNGIKKYDKEGKPVVDENSGDFQLTVKRGDTYITDIKSMPSKSGTAQICYRKKDPAGKI